MSIAIWVGFGAMYGLIYRALHNAMSESVGTSPGSALRPGDVGALVGGAIYTVAGGSRLGSVNVLGPPRAVLGALIFLFAQAKRARARPGSR